MSLFSNPFAQAIANAEGFGVDGAVPTRANNPGDLAIGDVGFGTTGSGITIFGSLEQGVTALQNQATKMTNGGSSVYNPNMTIAQAGSLYSNGDPNWASNVAKYLGLSPSDTLATAGKTVGLGDAPTSFSDMSPDQMQQTILGLAGSATTGTQDKASSFAGIGLARIVSVILGLITTGAGLMMFKPVRDVSLEFGKGVAKGVSTAAIV